MRRLTLTEEAKQVLNYERAHHPHPRVRKQFEVLWLKSQGLPHQEITRLADVSNKTLCTYLAEYAEGGSARLQVVNCYCPQSELVKHQAQIETHCRAHPPATANEARARIADLTGLHRAPTAVRTFLKRCGLKRLKTGVLPAKPPPGVQAAFTKKR